MESSISPHLVCPRSRPRRIGDDYAPPYPAWSARIEPSVQQLVIANHGVQWNDPREADAARAYLAILQNSFKREHAVRHVDLSHCVDEAGYDTLILTSYWTDSAAFDQWCAREDIRAAERNPAPFGRFTEILSPSSDRLETLFSTEDEMEGAGRALLERSPAIREHAYWGSARDRLPIAQTDALAPDGELHLSAASAAEDVVIVKGHSNVAVIRSGQDWTPTTGEERRLYLESIAPVLKAGMDFLRDEGDDCGCYLNRYMQMLGNDGEPGERTFGWSYWRSLTDMEQWSEHHPTHLAIFGTFMQMVQALNFDLKLRLWHEVYVLTPEQQHYVYRNCHPRTGLLRNLARQD